MLRGLLGGFARGRRQTSAATLVLDFLAGLNDSRITYSGGANGTRVNSSGNIVAATTPRFDYDPVTLAAKGLLVEEARTNLLFRSAEFDNAAWTKFQASISANTVTSPDGTTNADSLIEDLTNGVHVILQDVTVSASTVKTLSVFGKKNTRERINIQITDTGANSVSAFFDLNAGTVIAAVNNGTGTGATASIEAFPNGWYRCVLTGIPAAAGATVRPVVYLTDSGNNISYQGDGTSGLYLWGAQLEAGSFPTSYIPTTSASVTRTADSAVMTGTNFSSWYNQSEGTFVWAGDSNDMVGTPHALSVSDGTNNEAIILRLNAGTSQFVVFDGGGTQASLFSGNAAAGVAQKMAAAYAVNNFAFTRNAATVQTDVSGSLPTVDALRIGAAPGGGSLLNGHIQQITYFPRRVSNEQLQAMTA